MSKNRKRCFRWGARLEKCPHLEIDAGELICTRGGEGLRRIQYDALDLTSGRIVLVEPETCPDTGITLERWDGSRWRETKGGEGA